MTKRKADHIYAAESPTNKAKLSHFAVPQWSFDEQARTMDMVTSPPIKRARIFSSPTEHRLNTDCGMAGHGDTDMGSPNQRPLASPRQTPSQTWRTICTKYGRTGTFDTFSDHAPSPELSVVSRTQFEAVQTENTNLKDTVIALTMELAEFKSKVAQLELQCSQPQQISRGCLATGFRSPYTQHEQQPMYFAPHRYVPLPQYSQ